MKFYSVHDMCGPTEEMMGFRVMTHLDLIHGLRTVS